MRVRRGTNKLSHVKDLFVDISEYLVVVGSLQVVDLAGQLIHALIQTCNCTILAVKKLINTIQLLGDLFMTQIPSH